MVTMIRHRSLRVFPEQMGGIDAVSLPGLPSIEIGCVVTSTELIVLIVRDHGLRSALIAHLSLQGESLVTLDADPDDPILHRAAPAPRFLVIDEAGLGDRLEFLVDGNHWRGIIVIADSAGAGPAGDRLRTVHSGRALVEVVDTLADWRMPASAGALTGGG